MAVQRAASTTRKAHAGRAGTKKLDPAAATGDETDGPALPLAAIALRLLDERDDGDLIYIAADERQADEIGRILARFAPATEVLVFPPWDSLPFDHASPSPDIMGRRVAVLQSLAAPARSARVVVTTVDAALQKAPPPACVAATFTLAIGETVDLDALRDFAERTGYGGNERVDEPGELECHGQVIEVFPPGAPQPYRIVVEHDAVAEISPFDPVSQRSTGSIPRLVLGPASEVVFSPEEGERERSSGCEHRLPEFYDEPLRSLFDLMPEATIQAAPGTAERRGVFLAQVQEAHEARGAIRRPAGDPPVRPFPALERLFVEDDTWTERLADGAIDGSASEAVPSFASERRPAHAFQAYVDAATAAGTTVVLAGVSRDLDAFARFLERHGGTGPRPAEDWAAVEAAKPGAFLSLDLALDEGLVDTRRGIALVAAADVLGTRAHRETSDAPGAPALLRAPPIKIGDTVIHEDHGIGILRGLEEVEIAGEAQDAVRLEYHGGGSLLAPVTELDKLWRYGSDDDVVALDRLHTDAWAKRRIELQRAVIATAGHLVALASEREARTAPKLVAPRKPYRAFAARFAFPETPDQARAIAAVVDDLGSGRPMDRLICGDVGFGKTEVALRAAAVAVMSGSQVALVAPTTVLAHQHLETLRKRFAGFGFEIAGLSRLVTNGEAKRVKEGLADGTIAMVVGTHAVADGSVGFADLGLLIIDEEQKFGAKVKADLRARAAAGHVLTMTATPIPRTLQMAMVGIQSVSIVATPPVRRRPIRTFVAPFDPASVRLALLREQARGGQSFVIVPRIADIGPMQARLDELVPELATLVAHADLPVEEVDRVMVGFAKGEADVLLATNIVESGLDVPRANTMLVWDADRFGLAQLHQLRGRVGRGRLQGVAYLLSEPGAEISDAARARLATLQSYDRLGSGFAISARDLDFRGAGDLVGDDQAGHMKLIGLGLYQSLLARAVRRAKGETVNDDAPPDIRIGTAGRIPDSYVAEPDLRIDLYARLSRLDSAEAIADFEDEIEDRFGSPPPAVKGLFALARVRNACRDLGVAVLSTGPRAVAATLRPEGLDRCKALVDRGPDLTLQGSKLVWAQPEIEGDDPLRRAEDFLKILSIPASGGARRPDSAATP